MKKVMQIKKWLTGKSFLSNVVLLSGGTATAQGFVILVSPLLTRMYTPDDFGVLTVYTAMLSIMVVITSMRYELAIPLPEDNGTAIHLAILSLIIVIIISILSGLGILFLGKQIANWVNLPETEAYFWLLPIGLLGAGTYQVLNYWTIRNQAFLYIARTKLSQSIGMLITQLALGLFKIGPIGLLIGDVVGRTCGSGTLAFQAWRQDKEILRSVSIKGIKNAAYRYRRFPLLSSGSALLNTAGTQLPVLLLAGFYGPQVAGWFALAQKIVGVPMAMVGRAVGQVYLGEASRLVQIDIKALQSLFIDTMRRLLILGFLPAVLLTLGGPELFTFVFGSNWLKSGSYVQVLALMFLVQFAVVPLSQTLNILERQDLQLSWDVGRLILVVGGLFLVNFLEYSAYIAIIVYGVTMLISYLILGIISVIALQRRIYDQGKR